LLDLVDALGDEEPTVSTHALATLCALTGRSLPPDQFAWEEALAESL
jgi:hypothetical protein